jgi:hypothetical protein
MRQRFLLPVCVVLGFSSCSSPATRPAETGGSGGEGDTGGATGTGGAAPKDAGSSPTAGSGGKGGTGGAEPGGTGGSVVSPDASASGGSGGAPAPDAGSSADGPPAATGDLCAGAKKCYGFEEMMAGQAPSSPDFKVETAGGTLTVDTTKYFSGKQSILIKTRGGTNFPGNNLVFSGIEKLLPANDLHGRVMMWMDKTPGQAHWDSIIGSAAGGSNPTYILGGMYANFMSVYHPGDVSVDSLTKFPTGTWACIQWQFSGKDGKNLHKMMLNGEVVDKGITERWKAPTFSQLKVGYRHFNTNVAVDVWLDDLAFGDQPIPCPPKM